MKKLKLWSIMILFVAISCSKKEDAPIDIAGIPILTTPTGSDVDSITNTSVIVYANVNSEGDAPVTAKGVCWSTSHNPTISDSKTSNRRLQSQTVDRTQNIDFTAVITDLQPGTTYYMRVYATNSLGTGYSNEFLVTTIDNTVTDVDGNVYHTVQIGTQTWLIENLRTTHYNDGSAITYEGDSVLWSLYNSGAYCYYNNDVANNNIYGKLYNWYAANSGRLAPAGWHVPSDAEWQTIVDFLGGNDTAGAKMKATTLWNSPNTGATNSSGFTAIPAGGRELNGRYSNIGKNALFWSTTSYSTDNAWYRFLNHDNIQAFGFISSKVFGASVRCVKD